MKIDKNNWCININETPEGELKELFKKWFIKNCGYKINLNDEFDYWYCVGCRFGRAETHGFAGGKDSLITIEKWYDEIYLQEQQILPVVEIDKNNLLVTKADLQQLEERLTKLIEEKFGNT